MSTPQVICLTPVKNEAWILDRFLRCASTWADRIIIADQGSDDGSREIAARFPKVQLIDNSAKQFNEPERQKLLIEAARRIPGPKLLIALDADEFLTANYMRSPEWQMLKNVAPGTVINFQWACMMPDRKSYYIFPYEFPLGFMDNDAPHNGQAIHSPRVPVPPDTARLSLREVKVMHFATFDWERFKSKIRWYQCWEFLNQKWNRRLVQLYRTYHRYFAIPDHMIQQLPKEWCAGYDPSIDLLGLPTEDFYRWDVEILRLFAQHGAKKFSKIAIWDQDWRRMHERIHGRPAPADFGDPRSRVERWAHDWLERTQPLYRDKAPPPRRRHQLRDGLISKALGYLGW
jgi:hypothetical protein